ncbi:MAG: (2Fe-2S)-binding protein [Pseudomonadota bacterium]
MSVSFELNGRRVNFDGDPQMPLLWAVREQFGLTGTKFGCGIAACGACTMHVDGRAVRTCVLPMHAVADARVTTIEGIGAPDVRTAVQEAWLSHQVPQCGYCQSGMIMAVEALLAQYREPTDAQIDSAITNICRCGTYDRLRPAIHTAAKQRRVAGA